ncbi:hypothetical protein DYGSA30_07570 [Dyella sp. GSA-30]|nr:hypothetical protein DYGSA30_07570 [Dyella sp. GSA-30]
MFVEVEKTMDWSVWLRWPSTILLILAAVMLLVTLLQLFVLRDRLQRGLRLSAGIRAVVVLVAFILTLLLGGTGWMIHGYRLLDEETPVAEIDARILSPQQWALTLHRPDGSVQHMTVSGDAWRLEALVVKWKLPAVLAGVPPLYRLDRLSGRYDDTDQEAHAPRTVIDLRDGAEDLVDLRKNYMTWLPEVDAVYGGGVYLPLVDQGHYTVTLSRAGGLVARADEATEQRMGQPF